MLSLLEEAQENGEIDPAVSAELLVDIVTGTINGIVR